jgi:solute carrier family 50 protein (sugar transporter)
LQLPPSAKNRPGKRFVASSASIFIRRFIGFNLCMPILGFNLVAMKPMLVPVCALVMSCPTNAFGLAKRPAMVARLSPQAASLCEHQHAAASSKQHAAVRVLRGGSSHEMSLARLSAEYAPSLGVLTSNALYFSSLPAVLRARREGSLGEFNPLPTTIMVVACLNWLGYALSVGDRFIVASNLPGAAAVLTSFVIMLPLTDNGKVRLVQQTTFVAGSLATLCLWSFFVLTKATAAARSKAIGLFASAIFIILSASPFSTIAEVLRSRDATSIFAPFTAAQVTNCALWTTYGWFAAKDVFVWGPNLIGLSLGLAQLALKLIF